MLELSLRHPFPVQLASAAEPDLLTIRAVFLGVLTDAQAEAWTQFLSDTFLSLARAGGLGGSAFAPQMREQPYDWTIDVEDSDPGTLIEWRVHGLQVAPEAVRVLANLFEAGMYKFAEHAIVLLAFDYRNLGHLSPTPGFAAAWSDCPFEVEEFSIEDENFDVEIVLESPITQDQVRALSGPVGAWLNTVAEGGFGGYPYDPVRPGAQWNEKLTSGAGRSIVLHLQQFYASPDALASLKNVLVATHRAGIRIEQVVIAE